MRVILVILILIGLGLFLTRSITLLGWFFAFIGFLTLFIKVILAASVSNHYVFSHMIDMSIPLFTDMDVLNKPLDKPLDKPVCLPVDKPLNKSVTKPLDKSVAKPLNKPVDKPLDKSADKPLDKPVDKPLDKSVTKPLNKPTDKSDNLKPDWPVLRALFPDFLFS